MRDRRIWTIVLLAALGLGCFVLDKSVRTPEGSTTLSWVAPTLNEQNEPLTDLAGYTIHCWADAGRYSSTFSVNDPTATSFVVGELEPGIYYCAMSAIDQDGDESVLSNVIAKSVP